MITTFFSIISYISYWGKGTIIAGWFTAKTYISASWIFAKPIIITWGGRVIWTSGVFVADWMSGKLYADNCIGVGFTGMYNHFWNMLSPACTGFLLSHVIFMGVFVASFLCTMLIFGIWGYNSMKEHEHTKEFVRAINSWDRHSYSNIHYRTQQQAHDHHNHHNSRWDDYGDHRGGDYRDHRGGGGEYGDYDNRN